MELSLENGPHQPACMIIQLEEYYIGDLAILKEIN